MGKEMDISLLMASVSRSFDLTGNNWGLRKKTQRQTYRKRGEMQVEFPWVQLRRLQEQCSWGVLLFTADYPH
jgi:hypothetical protein